MILSIFLSSFVIYLICFNGLYIGEKLGLLDKPNKGKIHKNNTPLLGGPIILIVLIIFLIFNLKINNIFVFHFYYMLSFFILGLIDDRINLNAYYRILLVTVFSLILMTLDESFVIDKIYFEISKSEYYFGKFKILVTLICILLLYIAINMSDGINCLLISLSIFTIIAVNFLIYENSIDIFDTSFLFALIFLIYFNYKNKIFLGNSGASIISSYFIYKLININFHDQVDVFEVISIFLIIGIDMVRLVITRIIKKKNPFSRDLNHFHHLLLKKMSLPLTIAFYLILSFGPVLITNIFNISVIFIIPISVIIYFYTISKLN